MKKEKPLKKQTAPTDASSVEQPCENVCTDSQQTAQQPVEALVNVWEEKYNELNDRYVRLMAEYDNYRKRTVKEKADLILSGGERVLVNLLPVVDNFERALETMKTASDVPAISQGVELIYQQLFAVLKQMGVVPMNTEQQPLDTDLHEAIATIPAPNENLRGQIIDCTQKGYLLNNKVIRHAKVVVGE
ncbi:MAG: nucleotide exchange factor GrpE [Prevotellaceae bacterium]|nr:nucleotide exchange factor GrpE [Prevotellaceae bacterium]